MDQSTERFLGQIDGKLTGLSAMVREHLDQDTRRFAVVFETLEKHGADINKAKGAKSALIWVAGGIATAVSSIVVAAQYILGK